MPLQQLPDVSPLVEAALAGKLTDEQAETLAALDDALVKLVLLATAKRIAEGKPGRLLFLMRSRPGGALRHAERSEGGHAGLCASRWRARFRSEAPRPRQSVALACFGNLGNVPLFPVPLFPERRRHRARRVSFVDWVLRFVWNVAVGSWGLAAQMCEHMSNQHYGLPFGLRFRTGRSRSRVARRRRMWW